MLGNKSLKIRIARYVLRSAPVRAIRTSKTIEQLARRLHSFSTAARSKWHGNAVIAGWYDIRNFGDQITPTLLHHHGFHPIHTPFFGDAELVGAGSILELVPPDFRGFVLGSGYIREGSGGCLPYARVLSVRGELTRQRLARGDEVTLGDPGLLLPSVLPHSVMTAPKDFNVGIVPHYVDRTDPRLRLLEERLGGRSKLTIIDAANAPTNVVQSISACRHILSSSLHGLVVADALAIPSRWIRLSDKVLGRGYKFRDYYSAFGLKPTSADLTGDESLTDLAALTTAISRNEVQETQKAISDAFQRFHSVRRQ